jgi:hypothetical protein
MNSPSPWLVCNSVCLARFARRRPYAAEWHLEQRAKFSLGYSRITVY